jgi:hypothetical protein
MKSKILGLLATGLVAVLTACPPPPTATLSVSPATSTLVVGSAATPFTATLTNATTAINWTINPNIGTLSPTPATGATVNYTPPTTIASSTVVTLTATSGTLTSSAAITVNPPATVGVSGTAVDGCGNPAPNTTVIALPTATSARQTTTTGANGTFSFTNLTTPYTLAVSFSSGGGTVVLVYRGLTRTTVRVPAFFGGVVPSKSGTITGNLNAGSTVLTLPTPAARKTATSFASAAADGFSDGSVTDNPYSRGVKFCTGNAATGAIRGMQWRTNATTTLPGGATSPIFVGHGERTNVTVADAGTTNNQDINLNTLTSGLLTTTINKPNVTYNLSKLNQGLLYTDGGVMDLGTQNASFGDAGLTSVAPALNTPIIAGTTMTVTAEATDTAGRKSMASKVGVGANDSTTITLPLAPSLGSPANNVTGINLATQSFNWVAFSGGMHLAVFQAVGTTIAIFTTSDNATIPSTSDLGLGTFAAATPFTWQVTGFKGTTTDALLNPTGAINILGTARNAEISQGESEARNFQGN